MRRKTSFITHIADRLASFRWQTGGATYFHIELSSRYRAYVAPARLVLQIAGLVLGLLVSWNVAQTWFAFDGLREVQARLDQARDQDQQLLKEAQAEGFDLSEAAVRSLPAEVALANQLLAKRNFSWTHFLSGLEEGLFPHEQSVMEREGLEEERRLAYVAITRARQRLYLSHAQTRMLHGQTRYNIPSRFLEEIPQSLLKWLTPRFSRQKAFEPDFSRQTRTTIPSRSGMPREVGGFRIGQNVMHAKFGPGVIIDAEGQGGDARVQVNFGAQGVKWLAVSVAKLQAA